MNCSTVAGAPVFSNYYKKRTIAGFKETYLSDAQHISPVMTRPRVPDDKRQRTARACDSCKRRKQKVSLQIISHISFIWPPDTWTLEVVISFCTLRGTHTRIHIHIHIHIHKHIHKGKQPVSRLYSRYYTSLHLNFGLLNVAICMPPPTCVQTPRYEQFMRETAKNPQSWLQQSPPSEARLMRVMCLLFFFCPCCCWHNICTACIYVCAM